MNAEQEMVLEFHKKFNCPISKLTLSASELLLRSRLIVEEASEFVTAASKNDLVEMADALADILYVTYGAAIALGIDMEPIFKEVHRANMFKMKCIDAGGKITRGIKYTPPDIEGKLKKQLE